MQALAERTGASFVRHATVPHQMAFTNKFGTEQGAALLRQHNNAQGVPEEGPLLWWAAAEVETAEAASTPGPAPSFAVNEATHTSWVFSSNLNWAYYELRTAPASAPWFRREDPFAEASGLLWLKLIFCALGAASLVGKSKPRR